jgi:hypothetical protein
MITHLSVHHFGGLKNDPYASTKHLTFEDINRAHESRWPDFPSELNGSFIGYNAIIFPDGSLRQARLVGEETAAVKKFNKVIAAIALAGNFSVRPNGIPVDEPTFPQNLTLENVSLAFLRGDPESVGLKVKPGTELNIKFFNINPHRVLDPTTQCYGSLLTNDWARSLVSAHYDQRIPILKKLIQLYQEVIALMREKKLGADVTPCYLSDQRG